MFLLWIKKMLGELNIPEPKQLFLLRLVLKKHFGIFCVIHKCECIKNLQWHYHNGIKKVFTMHLFKQWESILCKSDYPTFFDT